MFCIGRNGRAFLLKLVDLHTHSTFSDGTLSPSSLVDLARKRQIEVLALTDHDTTAGLPEFLEACSREGLKGIPGVELSAQAPYTLHILGYNITPGASEMEAKLSFLREKRVERNLQMSQKLTDLGIPVSLEEVEQEASGEVVARPHFARVLVRKGLVPDIRTAFRDYLGDGAPGVVPKIRLSPRECIEAIHSAGGVAVLAHPAQTGLHEEALEALLFRLREWGLWGLECISSHHDSEAIFRFLRMASRFDLQPTVGSDFHGGNRPGVDLGLPVSDGFLSPTLLGAGRV